MDYLWSIGVFLANFREPPKSELPRTPLSRTRVNKGLEGGCLLKFLCFRTQIGVQLHAGKGGAVGGLRDKGERRTGEALLSTEEVAEYLGVGRVTVYRWCKEGRIPCLKVGKL